MKILYVLPHPIQYQTPFINYLYKNGLDILVGYQSNISSKVFYDKGFNKKIKWGKYILKGHNFFFNKDFSKKNFFSFFSQKILTTILLDRKIKIVWVHGSKKISNILIIIFSKLLKKKVFLREENNLESKNRDNFNIFFNKIFYFILNFFVDYYLSIGKKNYKYYILNNINKKKIKHVPYAVDNNYFSQQKLIKKDYKKINFLFVGKLNASKGIGLLMDVMNDIGIDKKYSKKISFKIVGNGLLYSKIKKYVKDKKLDFIKILNFQSQKQLKSIYKKSDILILPSITEPWGLVINEALNAGNAIICSDKVGASGDLVIHKKNGFVFKTENKEQLLKCIISYLENNSLIDAHKKIGRQIVNNFSFDICLKNINKILHEIK